MALNDFISNAEISANPATGKVTGDDDPATTQNGVLTKLRDMGTDINTDLAALATIFDSHDHDPGTGTGGGGQLIGTDGVAAIGSGQVVAAIIDNSAITGGKTAANAITTEKIADDTVEKAQIGLPVSATKTGASLTFTFTGASDFVVFHVESSEPVITTDASVGSVDVTTSGSGVSVTCRAYGCTGIS